MRWLLRGARLNLAALMALIGGCGMLALAGRSADFPSLTSGDLRAVPLAAVPALAVVAGTVMTWMSIPPATLAGSVRSVRWLGTLTAVMGVMLAAVPPLVMGDSDAAELAARDAAGLCGIAALAWVFAGPTAASLAAPTYMCVAFLCGRSTVSGKPTWWAWVLTPAGDVEGWGLVAILAGFGVIAMLSKPQPKSPWMQ